MGKIKGWKKTKDTQNMERWDSLTRSNHLVSVYPAKQYGGSIIYVLFVRISEPKYVDDDIKGKTYISREFDNREKAINKAMGYMRSNPNG